MIASNESERLGETLARLGFCDEIVVVDGGSTDDTVAIARAAGAKVVENPWPGFAKQRNAAIDAAKSDWILEIDADERVTPQLADEIRAFLADPRAADYDMGALPMRHWFLGKLLGPAALYPGYRYRLFRRNAYRHDESRTVHEGLWANDRVWLFSGDIEHLLADGIREAFGDTRGYAKLEASALPGAGARAFVVGVAVRPPVKFFYRLTVERGWRDGARGVLKIALDCWSDVYVWFLRANKERVPGAVGHFGLTAPKTGSLRIAGVGLGARSEPARAWLAQAAAAGCDVVLITDARTVGGGYRERRLAKVSTLAIYKALALENQVRPYDAVLCDGSPATRRALKWFKRVRGSAEPATLAEPVTEALRRIERESRG